MKSVLIALGLFGIGASGLCGRTDAPAASGGAVRLVDAAVAFGTGPRGLDRLVRGNMAAGRRIPIAAAAVAPGGMTEGPAQTGRAPAAALMFTVMAGRSAVGSKDGPAGGASFYFPSAVAVDGQGVVYVADSNNHTIRKIAGGVVSTVAGLAGVSGSVDGTGAGARFSMPGGVALDGAGNIYVGDTGNNTIRKITPAGVVSTIAGLAGSEGGADGTGATARFNFPLGLVVDGAGNIFVADLFNCTIRKITPGGAVTTVAGLAGAFGSVEGAGSAARFNSPTDVGLDGAGNIYVADAANFSVRKITPGGMVSTLAGSSSAAGGTDGVGVAANFDYPTGLAVAGDGMIYIVDNAGHTLRKVTPEGVVTTLAGSYGVPGATEGTGAAARFSSPVGVAVDGAGNLYVADSDNHAIRKIAPGIVVSTLAGASDSAGSVDGGVTARFRAPRGLAVDGAGNLYVADTENHTIRKITPAGVVVTLAGLAGAAGSIDGVGGAARFNRPQGVAVDATGAVFVADTENNTVRKITPAGVVTTYAGLAGMPGSADGTGGVARFSSPQGVAVDVTGVVIVADTRNHTIRRIFSGGVVGTVAGAAGLPGGSADGFGGAAQFYFPSGVVVDAAGNIYVADTFNGTIRKIVPTGAVSTLAGLAGASGSIDGVGSAARFNRPNALTLDAAGDLYVANTGDRTIRKVTVAGEVSTVAGLAGFSGSQDGTGAAVRFAEPFGIAADNAGLVHVADSASNTIRKGVPVAKVSGGGYEFAANIAHANGNVYDQVLLAGTAATITADAGQVTRMSYIDLSDDIVQVEFSGPGSLTLRLDNASGPSLPLNYNQAVSYMKGHGTIAISGATAATHVSVFSVGTVTALNPALFKAGVSYDGVADIALLSISSADGRFGGVRLANAEFSSSRDLVGLYAPGVGFAGPVNLHNIAAGDQAAPVLQTGAIDTGQVGVTGGDMRQLNGRAIKIEEVQVVRMLSGATSHNVAQPAQANLGRYERNGQDVTAQVVQGP